MTRRISAAFAAIVSCGLAASIAEADEVKKISPNGHEAIKATVINNNPSRYTIDVGTITNLGANEDSPTFAVYTTPSIPSRCANFKGLKIAYQKDGHKRIFNLSGHPNVLSDIETIGCVVISNTPSLKR